MAEARLLWVRKPCGNGRQPLPGHDGQQEDEKQRAQEGAMGQEHPPQHLLPVALVLQGRIGLNGEGVRSGPGGIDVQIPHGLHQLPARLGA